MNQKIPFHQLSARIASATGISEDSAEIFAKNFFDILSEELIKGETVKIKGLGEFALYEEENGEKDIRFTPDKDLAETLNAPFAMFEPVTLNDEVTESMLSIEKDQTESSLPETENHEPEAKVEETIICENIATTIESQPETSTEAIQPEEHLASPDPKAEIAPEPETILTDEKPVQPKEAIKPPVATISAEATATATATEPSAKTANSNLAERQPVRPVAPKIIPLEEDPEEYVSPAKGQQSEGNFWWGLIIGLIIGLAIGACGVYLAIDHLFPNSRQQAEAITPEESTPMQTEETAGEIAMLSDSVTSDAEVAQAEAEPIPTQPAVAENSSPKVRKDTVKRGYLIHDMAKKFFGSKDYWVYIYEENKSKIGNPNNMQPGVVLDIPDAEKYGIVPGNAESLKKARQKAGEILARYPR